MNRALPYLHGGSRGITLTVPLTLSNLTCYTCSIRLNGFKSVTLRIKRQDSHNLRFA